MFTPEAIIDTITNTQKQMVNTFVTNDEMKTACHTMLDTGTEYTKNVVKAQQDAMTALTEETVRVAKKIAEHNIFKA